MKKITFKSILFLCFTLVSLFLTAQTTAPDEDTGSYTTCNPDGANATRTSNDLPNPINDGTIDDRTCYANYKESSVNGKTWGVYNITDGSNQFETNLQPRMERSLPSSGTTGVGSFARFTGTFRILEVGDAGIPSQDGSYISQAKGKHTGGGGSPDPAICLYLAKPVYGTGSNSDKQVAFDIYAERILVRGGSGSGREVVLLKRVNKNEETDFVLEIGFRQDPNNATKKIHYCDAVIGGEAFNWNIPEPERATESKIRYGAYRVKGGRAQIRWANTTYQKAEVIDNGNPDPIEEVYRLRNVATGKFLTAVGNSATPTTMTDSGEALNTHWTFVESGDYYNIDNQENNINALRAVNANPYLAVSTAKDSPTTDTDKSWTIHYNESNDTYRFESRFNGRILYHETDDSVYHKLNVLTTDDRGNWEAIPTSVSLSVSDVELNKSSIKIYPNPAEDRFTIAFKNLNNVEVKIYNILGKVVYESATNKTNLEIQNNFPSGIYLVKAITDNQKVYHTKLIIK